MSIANVLVSTGTKQAIAAALAATYAYGTIWLFSGAPPADGDSAFTGTLLAKVSKDGNAFTPGSNTNGLSWTSAAGVLSKASETWKAVGVAVGTIGYGVLMANAVDAGSASTTLNRLVFTVGVTSGVMQLTSLSTTIGSITTIDTFSLTLATQ